MEPNEFISALYDELTSKGYEIEYKPPVISWSFATDEVRQRNKRGKREIFVFIIILNVV